MSIPKAAIITNEFVAINRLTQLLKTFTSASV